MEKTLLNRSISVILTIIMLLSFIPEGMITFSDGETISGMGIINNLMTEDNTKSNTYTFSFKKDNIEIPFNSEIDLGNGLYLEVDNGKAVLTLKKGQNISLADNTLFTKFIKDNDIDSFTVSLDDNANDILIYGDKSLKYELKEDDINSPIYETDEEGNEVLDEEGNPYVIGYNKKYKNYSELQPLEFDSTPYIDYVITQEWRDRGDTRPSADKVTFTINQTTDGTEFTAVENTKPTHEKVNSNTDTYTYHVPEYSADNEKYTYTVNEQILPEQAEGNYSKDIYRVEYEKNNENDKGNTVTNVGLTEFTFSFKWYSGADETAIPEITPEYIKNNFSLYKTESSDGEILNDENIIISTDEKTGEITVTIKGLEDIKPDGTANVYYIQSNKSTLSVNSEAETADKDNDYFLLSAQNNGVNSSELSKIYNNGTLNALLTGTTEYKADIKWNDGENADHRKEAYSGDIVVWRYIEGREGESAQVETIHFDGGADNVKLESLPKYDINGNKYVYYGKEKLSIPENDQYDGMYKKEYYDKYEGIDSENNIPNTKIIPNNGTVVNSLSKQVEFSVEAEWIAAARQGGTAKAVYELQRKVNGKWVAVPDVENITMDFQAEKVSDTMKFDPTEYYDKNGNPYEFRVVEKSVERNDGKGIKECSEEIETGKTDVKINLGDDYSVTASVDAEDNTIFKFQYKIEGTKKIKAEKVWRDLTVRDHSDDSVDFSIKQYDYESHGFKNYKPVSDPKIDSNGKLVLTDADKWIYEFDAPAFDEQGHELDYNVIEDAVHLAVNYPYYVVPSFKLETDENGNKVSHYIITNYESKEGESRFINVRKEWIDDGERQFRDDIKISATKDAYSNQTDSHTTNLSEETMWENRFQIDVNYNKTGGTPYNPEHFSEYSVNKPTNVEEEYIKKSEIKNVPSDVTKGAEWIYYLESARNSSDSEYTDFINDNTIIFPNFAGIYNNGNHYYAVEQVWDDDYHVNGQDGQLVFKNIRIGVVNYKIHFDWKLGGIPVNQVTIKILDENTQKERTVVIENAGSIDDYFILNLPKYDTNGKVIEYKITEINIDGQTVTPNSDGTGSCSLKDNFDEQGTVSVKYEENNTDYGKYNTTDDLRNLTITNKFEGTTDFTVNKQWKDNKNEYKTRPDLYVSLYRYVESTVNTGLTTSTTTTTETLTTTTTAEDISLTTTTTEQNDTPQPTPSPVRVGAKSVMRIADNFEDGRKGADDDNRDIVNVEDYLWNGDIDGTRANWKYIFEDLPKYDANGKRYTYLLSEKPVEGYITRYDNTGSNINKQYSDSAVYDDGTIVNTLYDEVTVSGEKLWKKVPKELKEMDYPIADIYLKKVLSYKEDNKTPDKTADIAWSEIRTGNTSYSFNKNGVTTNDGLEDKKQLHTEYVAMENGEIKADKDGNICFPKYDTEGKLIDYTLEEEAIPGYEVSRVPLGKELINEYTGGNKVEFTLTKLWKNTESEKLPKKITLILHQVYKEDDKGEYQFDRIKYKYCTDYKYTVDNPTAEFSYTFGIEEKLRLYAPNGEEYKYYVTEELTNYLGEKVSISLGEYGMGYLFEQIGEQTKTLSDDTNDKNLTSRYSETVQNTYQPEKDSDNRGSISVTKNWVNKVNSNNKNSEFDDVKGYEFTLSRKTRYFSEELFTVKTKDRYSDTVLPELKDVQIGDIESNFALSSDGNYYTATIAKVVDKENNVHQHIVIKVYQDENNKVEVLGLLQYAQDSAKYDYYISESRTGYTTKAEFNQGTKIENEETSLPINITNTLDTFDITLHKVFAKKYDRNGQTIIEELSPEDYNQYFNDDYVKQLKFTLQRKTESESFSDYIENVSVNAEDYSYTFKDVPKYDINGNKYTYKVIETTSNEHVSVSYSVDNKEFLEYNNEALIIDGSKAEKNEDTYVRNIFEAKEITVKKVWEDNNNVDGVRLPKIEYTINEVTVKQADESKEFSLDISGVLENKNEWKNTIELPVYYYNGDGNSLEIQNIKYSITEDTELGFNYNSEYTINSISDSSDFNELCITNIRNNRLNGKITLTKTWNDYENKWGLRPDIVYFRLYRKLGENGTKEVVTTNYNNAPINGLVAGKDYFEVSVNQDGSINWSQEYLPYGFSDGANIQDNGNFQKYYYWFEECDAYSNELNNKTNSVYTYNKDLINPEALTPDVNYSNGSLSKEAKNTLVTTKHTVTKTWEDWNNYYKTREDFTIQLQRRIDNGQWENVEYCSEKDNQTATDETGYAIVDAVDDKGKETAKDNTHITVFENLPKYDADGNLYQYRAIEVMIGNNVVEEPSGTSLSYHTKNYNVVWDENYTDNKTSIKNELITSTEPTKFAVEKTWDDNKNEDGKRPDSIIVSLVQKYKNTDTETAEFKLTLDSSKKADNDTKWRAVWENLPKYDKDGREYSYSVKEQDPTEYGYTLKEGSEDKKDSDCWTQSFTNKYNPQYRNLIVSKSWVDSDINSNISKRPETVNNNIRPENVSVTLYCRYNNSEWKPVNEVEEVKKIFAEGYVFSRIIDSNNTITFENLPIRVNPNGTAVENATSYPIEYKVVEVKKNGYTKNDITSEKLDNGTDVDNRSITISNTIDTGKITVSKKWNDNSYTAENLHYDIDVTVTCDEIGYTETQTISKDGNAVTFEKLPIYDKNGIVLNYVITEKVHESDLENHNTCTQIRKYGYQLSAKVDGTIIDVTNADSVNKLTANTVDEINLSDKTNRNVELTNTLPVHHYKAEKYWDDNNNQDGKRPDELKFTLSRDKNDISQPESQKDGSTNYSSADKRNGNVWSVDFGAQPIYDSNNVAYEYSCEEQNLAPYYTADESNPSIKYYDNANAEVSEKTEDGTTLFGFTNKYTPQKDKINLNKNWNDIEKYVGWTRPESVSVELYCSYDGNPKHKVAEDDLIRNLLGEYKFTRVLSVNNNWGNSFDNLPVYLNESGTAVFNGEAKRITYYVVEESLNGYSVAYSPESVKLYDEFKTEDSVNSNNQHIDVYNTLKTTKIKVVKKWNDNGYKNDDAKHYNIDVQLKNGDTETNYKYEKTVNATDINRTKDTSDYVIFDDVPLYLNDGKKAEYTLKELNKCYGYESQFLEEQKIIPVDIQIGSDDIRTVNITNTLPLTQVKVTKTWEDENNKYGLRPDSITLKLYRKTISQSEWETVRNYTLTTNKNGNTWTYLYSDLLKYNDKNEPYLFKIEEAPVNAYDNVSEPKSTITADENNTSLELTNKLITEKIKIYKKWDDHSYNDADKLHYAIPITLTSEKITINNSQKITDITIPNKTSNEERFVEINVPVYDINGNPIKYSISEDESHYGYIYTDTSYTQNGTHNSYTKKYYDTYTITNELPLTTVKVEKEWANEDYIYKYLKEQVTVNLSRKSNNIDDSNFNKTDSISADSWTTQFDKLLVYDYDNNQYTYSVTENTVKGFTTSYSGNGSAVKDATETLTVTNTPITGSVTYTKYDRTFENIHLQTDQNTKVLSGAEFKLYKVDGDIPCNVKKNGDKYEYYVYGNDTITSGANGKINLDKLPLGRYYLVETKAPSGYRLDNTTKFYFTVDVNDSNIIKDVERETSCSGVEKNTDRIPNDELDYVLILTKQDAVDNHLIPNASYYLLKLKNKADSDTRTIENYKSSARDAAKNESGDMWEYWEIVNNTPYKTDSNGMIVINGLTTGNYLFHEIQSVTGYERDLESLNIIEIVQGANKDNVTKITHNEPRKKAHIKVLKIDENGKTLENAEFELYKKKTATSYEKIDSKNLLESGIIITGIDGLSESFEISEWGEYAVKETKAPSGYNERKDDFIEFVVDEETVEETIHIVKVSNTRYKGSIELTKTSSEQLGDKKANTLLEGAWFELYKKNGTLVKLYQSKTDSTRYRVVHENENVSSAFKTEKYDYAITGIDGKLHIEGLDWGEYYLMESKAPTGYAESDVNFVVGRSNCQQVIELTAKDKPVTAQLKIDKELTCAPELFDAWGEPTFIFKIRKTDGTQREQTVSITFSKNGNMSKTTDWFDIEPGSYEVSEMKVSRYELTDTKFGITEKVSNEKITDDKKAVFTISENGKAEIKFTNELKYYDKYSHVTSKTNKFNGVKGFEVSYDTVIPVGTKSLNKSALKAYLIGSDGERIDITDKENISVKCINGFSIKDNGSDIEFIDSENTLNYVYTLEASYEYGGKTFTDTFDIHFDIEPVADKKEITVTFMNDNANYSYYIDGNSSANVYKMLYIITTFDGKTETYKLHNGVSAEIPQIKINDAYADKYEFAGWKLNGDNTLYTKENAEEKIESSTDNLQFTAVLTEKQGG